MRRRIKRRKPAAKMASKTQVKVVDFDAILDDFEAAEEVIEAGHSVIAEENQDDDEVRPVQNVQNVGATNEEIEPMEANKVEDEEEDDLEIVYVKESNKMADSEPPIETEKIKLPSPSVIVNNSPVNSTPIAEAFNRHHYAQVTKMMTYNHAPRLNFYPHNQAYFTCPETARKREQQQPESFLKMALENQENQDREEQQQLIEKQDGGGIDANVLPSSTKLPLASPSSRPKSHVLPHTLCRDDLFNRFPANLQVKRDLLGKHGSPHNMPHHQVSYLYMYPETWTGYAAGAYPIYTVPVNLDSMKSGKVFSSICHFCGKQYKHQGTLRRHFKSKHEYYGPPLVSELDEVLYAPTDGKEEKE